jgi:F0F1-type ATP synthase assembly protein I
MAVAMEWTSRVTTVSLEMVLPALLGHWADEWLNTKAVFLIAGAVLGLVTGMWHLIQMTRPAASGRGEQDSTRDETPPR